jgi:2-keto-4-pentenoate hydratase/2-oxohepta-3-ene-1,7-dioic acid hydratase in catechol pathway
MKLVSLAVGDRECAGVVIEGQVLLLEAASGGRLADPELGKNALPLKSVFADPEMMREVRDLAARGVEEPRFLSRFAIPLRQEDLHAPIPRPGKVLCLGLNYRDHAAESGAGPPDEPVVFTKASSSVIGPGAPIRLPRVSDQIDYEVELAVVVGPHAKNVSAEEAMYHVAGYTVLNDVTARDYQRERGGGQWTLAKSFDSFCPIGPWIVTPDEVPDPHDLSLECTLSGETMQSSSTSQMIFRIPEIIAYLSAALTLEPGDVIGTGTPAGVGFARTPPRFLRDGDVVECTMEGVGTLVNPVRG